ncbi:hypothetical protein ACD589_26975 [Rhizobium sp. 814_E9_N1_1]
MPANDPRDFLKIRIFGLIEGGAGGPWGIAALVVIVAIAALWNYLS